MKSNIRIVPNVNDTCCEFCMSSEKEEYILRVRTVMENIWKSKDLSGVLKE